MKIYKIFITDIEKAEVLTQLETIRRTFGRSKRFPEATSVAYRAIDGIIVRFLGAKLEAEY